MGFLELGIPLNWSDSDNVRELVKRHGIAQLVHVYEANKDRIDADLRWGDEVEFALVNMNDEQLTTQCALEAPFVLEELAVRERLTGHESRQLASDWHPEFGSHMVEAIPFPPFRADLETLVTIEPSMRLRRAKIQAVLPEQVYVTSMAAYPRFGLPGFTSYTPDPETSCSGSIFIPDELINPHPRFRTLVANIRSRRGAKPSILIPVFKDKYTDEHEMWEKSLPLESVDRLKIEELSNTTTMNPVKDHIYMDCFAFGMGMSCIQATFAAPNLCSARYLYDQFVVLAPLFLALTAATPALRGLLADTDTRWSTLEQAVDCRTHEEETSGKIPKSRYSAASLYIGKCEPFASNNSFYNDTNPPLNHKVKDELMEKGMDEVLATHFAHLWIRDPLVIFSDRTELTYDSTEHFENIQSTNWNSVRFKLPPPVQGHANEKSPIPWRVEFRTPEAQLTDYDNAAAVAIIYVLTQMILKERLDFYIPMSKNDENMHSSWQRDAAVEGKFWFRHDISYGAKSRDFSLMTMDEIMNGCKRFGFEGLLPMCLNFVERESVAGHISSQAVNEFRSYCRLYSMRASGEVMTTAKFLRTFITAHPNYNQDSVVTEKIAHDVCALAVNIGLGLWTCSALHGELANVIPRMPLPIHANAPIFSSYAVVPSLSSDLAATVDQLETVQFGGVQKASVELRSVASEASLKGSSICSGSTCAPWRRMLAPGGSFVITCRDPQLLDEITDIYSGLPASDSVTPTSVPDASVTWLKVHKLVEGEPIVSPSGNTDGATAAELLEQIISTCCQPISSEDFTRCWLMKGGFETSSCLCSRFWNNEGRTCTTCPESSACGEPVDVDVVWPTPDNGGHSSDVEEYVSVYGNSA